MKNSIFVLLTIALVVMMFSCDDEKNPTDPSKKISITSITPQSVDYGETMIIFGKNFGSTQDKSFVSFAETKTSEYISWSDIEIRVKVPIGIKSGKLSVLVGSEKSNEVDFIIKNPSPNIDLVLIPAGTFQMGNSGIYSGKSNEYPLHQVTISHDFYMSKYEITQAQYLAVMGTNPSSFKGNNLPVEKVNWINAIEFCNKLSELEGLEPCYVIKVMNVQCNWEAKGYRLPTEAEWEYACKAATTSDFYNGILTNAECTPLDNNLEKIEWYCGNSDSKTHEVGQKAPNAFGLFDMCGNVKEWCWDLFGDYENTPVIDPKGAAISSGRTLRGGSWLDYPTYCRCSQRTGLYFKDISPNFGFRICRTI